MNILKDYELFARSKGFTNKIRGFSNPMVIEERSSYATTYDIFSRLLNDRIIFLGETIDDDVANSIQAQLLYLAYQSDEDISIYINSPGGYVSAGLAIYDTMQLVKPDINTICTGSACSMASILLTAGTKGKRSALQHSKVMIHQPSGFAAGQASDILIEANEIEKCRKELIEILAKHTGQNYDKVFTDADRDFWMTSKEALDYGLIDKIQE